MKYGELLAAGQKQIDQGNYDGAIAAYTSAIGLEPKKVDAYCGRAVAKLMLDRYSDAFNDIYAQIVSAVRPRELGPVLKDIVQFFKKGVAGDKDEKGIPDLAGQSLAHWAYFDYANALPLLDQILRIDPNNTYGILYRGSNHMFLGQEVAAGQADLERAIQLRPNNAQLRHIVADAYTYAQKNLDRAHVEASRALDLGLDTPRIQAILAVVALSRGDLAGGAARFQKHIRSVTKENVSTAALAAGGSMTLDLVPGRTFEIPVRVAAGESLKITTGCPTAQIFDTLLVLLGPDGTPIHANDDFVDYFAGLDWRSTVSGACQLRVTSFEGVSTGPLVVSRA
jgi:Flp pilus assembly protein TadD